MPFELLNSDQARWRCRERTTPCRPHACRRQDTPLNTVTEPITAAREGILNPVQQDKDGNRS
jgi:hypothetical protein